MEVFGGEHAISVNGETARPGTDLIVGQWDGPGGRYGAAVWELMRERLRTARRPMR